MDAVALEKGPSFLSLRFHLPSIISQMLHAQPSSRDKKIISVKKTVFHYYYNRKQVFT
jgi:hypothetical protein